MKGHAGGAAVQAGLTRNDIKRSRERIIELVEDHQVTDLIWSASSVEADKKVGKRRTDQPRYTSPAEKRTLSIGFISSICRAVRLPVPGITFDYLMCCMRSQIANLKRFAAWIQDCRIKRLHTSSDFGCTNLTYVWLASWSVTVNISLVLIIRLYAILVNCLEVQSFSMFHFEGFMNSFGLCAWPDHIETFRLNCVVG